MSVNTISWKVISIHNGLISEKQKTVSSVTLSHIFDKYLEKGRITASSWKEGEPNKPHYFYDSDVAKLIEAVAYSLVHFPDAELQTKTEKVIDDLLSIQEPDGYLNSYFHNVAPDEKWTDIRIKHELYCAGHLIEAGIAWYQATGNNKLLQAMCKYADLISRKFGERDDQVRTWPGHQEIELALVRLYEETKEEKYLHTASFFVEDRGKDTSYWFAEAEKLGLDADEVKNRVHIFQAHLPAEKQETAEGHAVRACYFYSGMADIARIENKPALLNACRKIWRNIVDKRMNITGGIGSDWQEERFTYDYDLAEEYYYETCAQISLFFFAHRMFLNEQKSEYGDIMELTLYNSILSGLDAEGRSFFYSNPLVNVNRDYKFDEKQQKSWGMPIRQTDFSCSCCPPNISRLLMSIEQYIYAVSSDSIFINLFIDSEAELKLNDSLIRIKMKTDYPWDENVLINMELPATVYGKIKIRMPGWCSNPHLEVNGDACEFVIENGFAVIERNWENDDCIGIKLPMPVEIMEAHPAVRQAAGKVAIQRGPVVYCLEEVDNGNNIFNISLLPDSEFMIKEQDITGMMVPVINFNAKRKNNEYEDSLYYSAEHSNEERISVTAIPYFMWANRGENEMTVWILKNKN